MDRPVVPSYLQSAMGVPDSTSNTILNYSEVSLRTGIIEEVLPPNHPRNRSKRYTEYNVGISYVRGASNVTYKRYYSCVQMDTFGSLADTFQATLRKSTKPIAQLQEVKGARVLVLCINDDTAHGIIVGGTPNSTIPPTKEDLGHHLKFEFNGVLIEINKDGEASIAAKGPTDENGDVLQDYDPDAATSIKMLQNGNVEIRSGYSEAASVVLDAANGAINLNCTDGGLIVNSGEYSMVRGEEMLSAMENMYQTISDALKALVPAGTGTAAVAQVEIALKAFQSTKSNLLSSKNKVE
jgi:hypothetical protein